MKEYEPVNVDINDYTQKRIMQELWNGFKDVSKDGEPVTANINGIRVLMFSDPKGHLEI